MSDPYRSLFDHLPAGLFRAVVEASPQGIVVHREGRIVFANPAAARLVGAEAADHLLGRPVLDFVHPDSVPAVIERMRKSYEDRQPAALAAERFVRIDGKAIDVEVTSLPIELEGMPATVVLVTDVTEQRRVESELRKLVSIVENSADFIGVTAPDRQVLYVNAAGRRMVGLDSLEEACSKKASDYFVEEDREAVNEVVFPGLMRRESVEFALRLQNFRTGEAIPCEFKAFFIKHWTTGEPIALATIGRDVTERKRFQAELDRARDEVLEAARLKSAFLSNMSHEIRTPLNIILGYVSLMADQRHDVSSEVDERKLVLGVERATHRLVQTIHGVLDLAKMEVDAFDLHPRPLNLSTVVRRQLEEVADFAKDKGVVVRFDDESPRAEIRFDEYCLTRALSNLFDNAVKFTAAGSVTVRLRRQRGILRLDVQDTGIGMDAEYLGRLFEPFSQERFDMARPFEGSGVGLALTRRYLELNGASISVESVKGGGSTFSIDFSPRVECAAEETAASLRGQ